MRAATENTDAVESSVLLKDGILSFLVVALLVIAGLCWVAVLVYDMRFAM